MNISVGVYKKPVTVLTDAACVSACEIFVAAMKDNGLAEVVGEDLTTVGGGAAVYSHWSMYQSFLPEDRKGPFRVYRNEGDIVVSWLQSRRTNGQLIENRGIPSDRVIRPTSLDDLYGDGLYLKIRP